MTFGLSHNLITKEIPIQNTLPAETQQYITTFLASLPWDKPYFYMTPSEHNLLSLNAMAKSCRVTVIHRGNRIAFETAASTTKLATLNNIQNIAVGYGLNKSGIGFDTRPIDFKAGSPMEPTDIDLDQYNTEYINKWYGHDQTQTTFNTLADVQLGYKALLRRYFNIVTDRSKTCGIPSLAEKIQFFDGKTTINQVVANHTYDFELAPLKKQSVYYRFGIPQITVGDTRLNIETNASLANALTFNLNNQNAQQHYTISQLPCQDMNDDDIDTQLPTGNTYPDRHYYCLHMEKANYLKRGFYKPSGDSASLQPSVHIGIQPIPSLSTEALTGTTTAYTDCQADFEVIAELDVEEGMGTNFPWLNGSNKAFGDMLFSSSDSNRNNCSINGRHTMNPVRTA